MTSKVIEGHKSSSNFSVNPTLPLMYGPLMLPSKIMCISLSLTFHLFSYSLSISLSISIFCSMQTLIYVLKGHMRPLLCRVIINDFQIFWSNYNLDLFYFITKIKGMTFYQNTKRSRVCVFDKITDNYFLHKSLNMLTP